MAAFASAISVSSSGQLSVFAAGRSASRPKLRFSPSLRLARRSSSKRPGSQQPSSAEMTQMLLPSSGRPSDISSLGMGRGFTQWSSTKSVKPFSMDQTGSKSSSADSRLSLAMAMKKLIKKLARQSHAI